MNRDAAVEISTVSGDESDVARGNDCDAAEL